MEIGLESRQPSRARTHVALVLRSLLTLAPVAPLAAEECVFTNTTALAIAPATAGRGITVSELLGTTAGVTVKVNGLTASEFAGLGIEDFDLLLVAPTGQKILLMSNACALEFGAITFTFSKSGATAIPSADDPPGPTQPTPCANFATYKPGDYSGGAYGLEAPAPAPPYSTNLATLEGLAPNGAWNLYAAAATADDSGSLASWELRITAAACSGGPPATWELDVSLAGSGSGSVTSDPLGIDCPDGCSAGFADQTLVTLTAHPEAPSTFAGWSGACGGMGTECQVTMTAARMVTATFAPPVPQELEIGLFGDGAGSVTSDPEGIDCPALCLAEFDYGSAVTLTALAAEGSIFGGWTDPACGLLPTCPQTLDEAIFLQARFDLVETSLLLFFDGFESGAPCAWSDVAGSTPGCA